ncbi:TetR/AcrR family transcriptional regulator [Corynebacterium poyangense]|uniref:TetR/AcrR family transcriptional regulator n=2 Tax=Corynebacterium poyangense TaxID=2684405 RepID=A0A7H0SS17_9CORY|nr:TetR/AcrR family transcriptional regulator [Corynebacterium poyangense]QNQ91342.1 TetR/AcrR family transcriptional regulator [Corynebacterium poyangense]
MPLTPRQRELFGALLRDFEAEGFEKFTIESATKRYRCSKSTIYGIGSTRDEIISRVLVSYFKELARRTTPQLNKVSSYRAALEDYFTAITVALSPASPQFMFDLAHEPVARKIYDLNTQKAYQIISDLLERGVAAGEFSVESIPFASRLIQRSLEDIQQGVYVDTLPTTEAYHALGQIILNGLKL